MEFNALWIALPSAMFGLLVSLLTIQFKARHDHRAWVKEKKLELYVEALTMLRQSVFDKSFALIDGEDLPKRDIYYLSYELQARLALLSSEKVRIIIGYINELRDSLMDHLDEFDKTSEWTDEYEKQIWAYAKSLDPLREAMQKDLGVRERKQL